MAQGRRDKGKESEKLLFWHRLSGPWKAFFTLLSVISASIAIYGFLNQAEPLNAEEVRLDERRPQRLATNCRPYDPGGDEKYDGLSSAHLNCEPLGRGPETVRFHLFTNLFDLHEFMDLQQEDLESDDASCKDTGFPYASPWVDSRGRMRGELLCADYSDVSRLLWSHDDSLIVGSAASAPESVVALHRWWQREVRFGGHFPRVRSRHKLESLLPDSFGACRQMRLLAPAAIAGVTCRPEGGISSAGAELFTSEDLLASYLDGHASLDGIDSEGCESSPFSYTSYAMRPGAPALGYLLCRPDHGVQWFEWTALKPLVYAYASRSDSDRARLYEQWAWSLSAIG